jgi:microcystin-dependent protein
MTQAINLANFANSLDTSGGVPPSQLNAPVTIAKGGTNAATAADARTNLDVFSIAQTNAAILVATPTGEVKLWPVSSPPTGHLVCDGASLSTTTYAALFAVLGYVYGGSGASFNLPDFRDRMPIGAGTTYSANSSGGSADAIVVSHSHSATSTVTDPTHAHSYTRPSPGTFVQNINGTGQGAVSGTTGSASTGITVATSVATAGASGTNANLPPYRGIYFIIKT